MEVAKIQPRHERGLTLVELITTLAVTGACLVVVIPAWSGLIDRSQITSAANQLLTQLRFARSTAVTRNQVVSLCPSSDGVSCSGDPRGWHHGYIVYVDSDRKPGRSPQEPILRAQGAQTEGLLIHSTRGRPAIRFRPDGAAWGTNTSFRICRGDDTVSNRAVILYGTGRARVDRHVQVRRPVSCSKKPS